MPFAGFLLPVDSVGIVTGARTIEFSNGPWLSVCPGALATKEGTSKTHPYAGLLGQDFLQHRLQGGLQRGFVRLPQRADTLFFVSRSDTEAITPSLPRKKPHSARIQCADACGGSVPLRSHLRES